MALANVERIFNLNPGAIPVQAGGQRQHQNQFRGIWTAIPIIAGAVAWLVANRSSIISGAKTAMNVSECVMNNKLKIERDQCFAGMDFLRNNVRSLHHMDVFNKNQSIPLLRDVVEDIREHAIADQWFTEINQRTRNIWDNVQSENRMQLRSRISPLAISYDNMPRSVSDLVAWIHETAACNEANVICSTEKEGLRKKADSNADKLDSCRVQCAEDTQDLIERKGECKDLESIKAEKAKLMKEKETFLIMKSKYEDLKITHAKTEGELQVLKQKQADDLAAAIRENDKFFLRRWTGL
jgi:hypothetical protein